MELDARTCYRAMRTRDARFDGRFFTGVVTTGIFCRPVCPARAPRAENCRYFPHAAAAHASGFRPCLRCRPEAAPGTSVWAGTENTVARALRLITDGALDDAGVEALAERVGVGDRHLRRLFLRHLGATPVAVAQTQRVLFAKRLLDETDLPMRSVANAAGFASLRRFNDTMRATYARTPTELRSLYGRGARAVPAGERGSLTLSLAYRPPYDWETLLRYLSGRAIPGVEAVGGNVYRRAFRLETGEAGTIDVRCDATARVLRVRIQPAAGTTLRPAALLPIVARLRRQFDLDADPQALNAGLATDPSLGAALRRHPGLRVPGTWDGFELAVRAILGQQVSVRAATTIAGRLVARCTERAPAAAPSLQPFPSPARLAAANLDALGLTGARARTVTAFARAVAAGDVSLDPGQDAATLRTALCELPGIGPWTAEYIALRALRDPDAFPASDLGLRRAFSALQARGAARTSAPAQAARLVSESALLRAAESWRPWRAYAAVHLWTWEADHASLDR